MQRYFKFAFAERSERNNFLTRSLVEWQRGSFPLEVNFAPKSIIFVEIDMQDVYEFLFNFKNM